MSNTLTIGELISCATDQIAALTPTPRLEAELMLSHVLQRPRIKLIGYPEHQVDPHKYTLFLSLLERRKQREPLSYLLGQREFWGMSFTVTPDVLIPRPETETLIESALRHVPTLDRPLRVLDLGTGSGVIAVAIATELKLLKRDFSLTAADCSIAAL